MNLESKLLKASIEGDLELVVELLNKGVDPNCKDQTGRGPLLCFYPEIIKSLLDYGAIANDQYNENGHSVLSGLCYATSIFQSKQTSQSECVELLINNGANVELGYALTNETPLHHATAPMGDENLSTIKIILEHNGDPNAKTIPNINSHNFYAGAKTKGETPLHRAAAFCSTEVIELLLKYGANKTVLDKDGESPQSWACWYRRPKELIDKLNCD